MTSVFLSIFALFISLSTGQRPIPSGLPILQLRYPTTQWVTPGDTLLMSATKPLPEIDASNLHPVPKYLLLFIDLDVIYNSISTVVLHWYQPDLVVFNLGNSTRSNATPAYMSTYTNTPMLANKPKPKPKPENEHEYGHENDNKNTKNKNKNKNPYQDEHKHKVLINMTLGADYIAPQPPPSSHHRYVYLLFEQDVTYRFPDCFGYIFPQTMNARAGFDIRQFIEVAGLGSPVAGNYFFVEYDGPLTPTGTGTTMSRTSPTTTWMRSAPCSQLGTATATATSTFTSSTCPGTCEHGGSLQIVV